MIQVPEFWKAIATTFIWLMVVGAIAVIAIFVQVEPEGPIALVMIGAIVSSGFVWNWGRLGQQNKERDTDDMQNLASNEKRKRKLLSRRLQNYSDEELIALRQRMRTGEIGEDELADLIES